MADGLNDARAMRIAEVMTDFRTEAHRVSALSMVPPRGDERQVGYLIFNQAKAHAQLLLAQPFTATASAGGDAERVKIELKRIILDASSRRFQMHKDYLKIMVAVRWIGRRRQIGAVTAATTGAHRQNDVNLRTELAAITDSKVFDELKSKDTAAGHWQAEMPELLTLLAYVRTH